MHTDKTNTFVLIPVDSTGETVNDRYQGTSVCGLADVWVRTERRGPGFVGRRRPV